jgi:S-disulfanyl-L-cysteine oxidoreductase SoxD
MRRGIWLAASIGLLAGGMVFSQAAKSVWDGVYTAQQAARGAKLYAEDCAACHADDLLGSGNMPALSGKDFRKEWDGQSVGDLFERMSTSMPADRPGKLSKEADADILAFILKSNEFPDGPGELKPSTPELNQIRFAAAKPK